MSLVRLEPKRIYRRGGPPPRRGAEVVPFPNTDWRVLRRFWACAGIVLAALGAVAVVLSGLGIGVLEDRWAALPRGAAGAASVIALRAAELVEPGSAGRVTASAGAAFGALAGAGLALAGALGASAAAFGLGRLGSHAMRRAIGPGERIAADRLLERHGTLALLVTRPIPVLAEATALLAGASPLPWTSALAAAAAGSLPASAIYAAAGAYAGGLPHPLLPVAAALFLGGAYCLADSLRAGWRPGGGGHVQ